MAQDEQRVQVMGPEFRTLQGWRGERLKPGDTCCVLRMYSSCVAAGRGSMRGQIGRAHV